MTQTQQSPAQRKRRNKFRIWDLVERRRRNLLKICGSWLFAWTQPCVDKPSWWILTAQKRDEKTRRICLHSPRTEKSSKRSPNCLWFLYVEKNPLRKGCDVDLSPWVLVFNHKQFQDWWESHLKLLPARRAEVWEIASPISTFDRSLSHQFIPNATERTVLLRVFTVVIKFYCFLPSSFFHWAIIVKVIWLLMALPIPPSRRTEKFSVNSSRKIERSERKSLQ